MQVWVLLITPEGSSIQKNALGNIPLRRHGFKEAYIFTILFCLSKKSTSIAKRIKNVWIELQGFKTKACLSNNCFLPKSPFILTKGLSAITACSAKSTSRVLLIIFMESCENDSKSLCGLKNIFREGYALNLDFV